MICCMATTLKYFVIETNHYCKLTENVALTTNFDPLNEPLRYFALTKRSWY